MTTESNTHIPDNETEESDNGRDMIEEVFAQQVLDHKLTRWQAVKAYPKACIYISILLWSLIAAGYEFSAAGVVLGVTNFRRDFGYSYVSYGEVEYSLVASWQSALTGAGTAALVLSTTLATTIVDYTGRKPLFLACLAGTIAFIGVQFAATTIQVFFVGKFLSAFLLGMVQTIGVSYTAELTPLALRGISTTLMNLSYCIGPFVCAIVAYVTSSRDDRWAYRGIFCSQWFFAGTASILLFFIPESPYHYALRGEDEKALQCLRKIYPDGSAKSQLAVIRATIDEAKALSESGSWKELLNRQNLKRTLIAIGPYVLSPLSGVPYVVSYSTYYIEMAGFSTVEAFRISCGSSALSIGGYILFTFMIDRFGRRFVLLYGVSSLAIVNLLIAALGLNTSSQPLLTASVGFLTMYNFFYNSGVGPMAYAINAEIPTSRLRAKTIAFGSSVSGLVSCVLTFALPYMFNEDKANMGSAINFIFSGCCFVSLILFYFYLPETSGRSYEEIDEMFMAKVPYRKWTSYVSKFDIGSHVSILEEKAFVEHKEDIEKDVSSVREEEVAV